MRTSTPRSRRGATPAVIHSLFWKEGQRCPGRYVPPHEIRDDTEGRLNPEEAYFQGHDRNNTTPAYDVPGFEGWPPTFGDRIIGQQAFDGGSFKIAFSRPIDTGNYVVLGQPVITMQMPHIGLHHELTLTERQRRLTALMIARRLESN